MNRTEFAAILLAIIAITLASFVLWLKFVLPRQMEEKEMSQYSRSKEDNTEKKLREIGFELIEDTGRRTKGAGDKIMRHTETGLTVVVDHKSTKAVESIRFQRAWMDKIRKESDYGRIGLPMIAFTFYGSQKTYIAMDIADLEGVMY
jgi:hypothetical protein